MPKVKGSDTESGEVFLTEERGNKVRVEAEMERRVQEHNELHGEDEEDEEEAEPTE